MRIIHFADTHLGFYSYGKINDETGLNARSEDFNLNFTRVIDAAIEEKADLVIHSGDLFHSTHPNIATVRTALDGIKKLSEAKIPIVIIAGNHETSRERGVESPIRILGYIDQCYAWYKPAMKHFTLDNQDVCVVGSPYVRADARKLFNSRLEEIHATPGTFNILLAHQSIDQVEKGAETSFTRYSDDQAIDKAQIPMTFQYIALGHIHKPQQQTHPKNNNIILAYPGSTERTSISERLEKKGYYIVEVTDNIPNLRFVELPTRPMIEINYDVTGQKVEAIQTGITKALEEENLKDAIVSIKLQGKIAARQLSRIKFSKLYEKFNVAFHIKETTNDLTFLDEKRTDIIVGGQKIYTPKEELERFVNKLEMPADEKQQMIAIGSDIINKWCDKHGDTENSS